MARFRQLSGRRNLKVRGYFDKGNSSLLEGHMPERLVHWYALLVPHNQAWAARRITVFVHREKSSKSRYFFMSNAFP